MKLSLACAQMACQHLDPSANLDKAEEAVSDAVKRGVELILFPEYLTTGMVFDHRTAQFAESIDGPTARRFQTWTRRYGCWIGGGIIERARKHVHNTFLLIGPNGQVCAYRKRYLAFFENLYFHRGQQLGIFHTDIGRLGVMICWDMIHHRLVREMSGGIDLLLIISAWPDVRAGNIPLPGVRDWLSEPPQLRPSRLARQLQVPVAYCNMAGPFVTPVPGLGLTYKAEFAGQSSISDADGETVQKLAMQEETLLCAEVDLVRHQPSRQVA